MSKQFLGIVVSGAKTNFVHLECSNTANLLINQFSWSLQNGDKSNAYINFFERVRDYVSENNVQIVVIKASAVGQQSPKLGHLHSAELRGVVCVAAKTGGAEVSLIQKGTISRTFGSRKADEYIKDDSFWSSEISGDIAKTRREAALLILNQRKR